MQIIIEGLRIEYEDRGEGNPVLLLHGWMANIETMRPIANAVVSMGMRAISFDFPGFGNSEEPAEHFGVPEYARVTKEFISALQLEGSDIICHSFGGRVAIVLASEEPKLFNRLVFVDAAGIRPRRGLKYYIKTCLFKLGKILGKIGFIDKMFHISEKQKNAGSPDYRALTSDTMRKIFVKVVNLDLTPRLNKIMNPTLLIWGTEDISTPLYMGKIMEKHIPDSGLVELKGAGHFSYIDQYPYFCKIIQAFLK